MDFNFGNNNDPEKPEDENNNMFSFNPENTDANSNNSASDNSSPFEWTPVETSDSGESDQNEIDLNDLFSDDAKEETPQLPPNIPEASPEEVSAEVAEDIFSNESVDEEQPSQDDSQESQVNEFDEAGDSDIEEAEIDEDAPEDETDVAETAEAAEEAVEAEEAEEAVFEEEASSEPEAAPAPAALDKKVRTPDGEQEYLLSELIDVETGEPLDLTSLIPEELLTAAVAETTTGFTLGAAQPTTGGFDMSAGAEPSAPSKRRRPARPKAPQKKGGSIVGIIFGGLLAFILFPYVMALIEMTTGAQSNIPIPAPGIKSTYKYIPEWWPDWAMFVFPGRTTDAAADAPADKPADNPAPAVPEDNANPADDAAVTEDAPADDAVSGDDGTFDPDAFLANGGDENAAEPKDVLAGDKPADEPADAPADEPLDEPADEPADEPVAPAEPGVVNAPVYTSADVSEAVANVGTAFKAAKAIDDTVYAALNDMAEKSTFVDTAAVDDQLKDAMAKVRAAMGNFGTKAALASALSEKWAARVEDATDDAGVLFVGSLSDVSERDGYQISTINVEGQDGSVEVVGLRKIKPAVGDKVVVCGKRIADPEKNLGGFTDNGLPVVWGGIVIKAEEK